MDVDALQRALDLYLAGGASPEASEAPAVESALAEAVGPRSEVSRPWEPEPLPPAPPTERAPLERPEHAGDPPWRHGRRALVGSIAVVLVCVGLFALRNPFAPDSTASTSVAPVPSTAPASVATSLAPSTTNEVVAPVSTSPAADLVPSSTTPTTRAPQPRVTEPPRAATTVPVTEPASTEPPDTTVPITTVPRTEPPTSSPPVTEPSPPSSDGSDPPSSGPSTTVCAVGHVCP